MTNLSMILLSLGMLAFFFVPFLIIRVLKKRQESRPKQKAK